MICEKCGSNNPKNTDVCTKCGANMPATEMCGGFGDILSYEGPATVVNPTVSSGVDEKVVQNLEKRLNASVKAQKRLKLVAVISWAFSLIILVCFIFTSCILGGCTSCNKNKGAETGIESGDNPSGGKAEDTMKRSDFEQNKGSAGYIFSEVVEGIESIFN